MKNQPIRGIPRGLAYHNQPGGVDLTPPCRIGLSGTINPFRTSVNQTSERLPFRNHTKSILVVSVDYQYKIITAKK